MEVIAKQFTFIFTLIPDCQSWKFPCAIARASENQKSAARSLAPLKQEQKSSTQFFLISSETSSIPSATMNN